MHLCNDIFTTYMYMISPAFGNVLNLVEATVHHTVLNHGVFNYPHYNILDSNKSEILIYQWMNQQIRLLISLNKNSFGLQ